MFANLNDVLNEIEKSLNKKLVKIRNYRIFWTKLTTNRDLVSLLGYAPVSRAGGSCWIPGRTNRLSVLKQLRKRCCLCPNICKWLGLRIF